MNRLQLDDGASIEDEAISLLTYVHKSLLIAIMTDALENSFMMLAHNSKSRTKWQSVVNFNIFIYN